MNRKVQAVLQFLSKHRIQVSRNLLIAVFVALVLVFAGVFIAWSRAAGFFGATEPEQGTKSGNVTTVSDASASGGQAIQFKAPAEPPDDDGDDDSPSCALPHYPSASCTGVPAGTVLTAYTGPTNITSTVTIDSKEIHGCLTISAPGVVIKNSKIIGDCQYIIYTHNGSGAWLTIQDSEIDCGNQHGGTTAIGDMRVNAYRNNIHGCENGFDVDGEMTIVDNYIHDLYQIGGCDVSGPHTDGIQTWPNGSNITIQHNTIYAYSDTQEHCGNAAIINGLTGMANVVIKENLLAGGGYTLYCGNSNTLQVIDNHFSRIFAANVGLYGPWTQCDDDTISGNVYHETGLPL